MTPLNPWKTLSSRSVYTNPWISIREDNVLRPDGTPGIYGVVEAKIATGVVALNNQLDIYLVGQFRYPTNEYSWEIIEGGAEHNEEPLLAAKRELEEEAGLLAATWEALGYEFHLSNCFSNERAFIFLATNLTETTMKPEPTEVLELRKLPLVQAKQMVLKGEIKDALSVIAILLVAEKMGLF